MRERAPALWRRELRAGPRREGGFAVLAALPVEERGVSIRVLLADDQALVRSGFRMILDEREGSRSSGRRRTAPRRSSSRRRSDRT